MATTEIAVHGAESGAGRQPVVNDFSIQVATVNGSGSRAPTPFCCAPSSRWAFRFPARTCSRRTSPGLPTWYTIRASKNGYIARKKEIDFLVAMNPETAKEDVLSLRRARSRSTTSR